MSETLRFIESNAANWPWTHFVSLTVKDRTSTVCGKSQIGNVVRGIDVTEKKAASDVGFDSHASIPKVGLAPFLWNGTINHHGCHSTGMDKWITFTFSYKNGTKQGQSKMHRTTFVAKPMVFFVPSQCAV